MGWGPERFSERQQLVIVTTSVAKTPSASLPMDAQFETEEGYNRGGCRAQPHHHSE